MSGAIENWEEAVRAGQLARTVLPDIDVLPHTGLCPVESHVYMKTKDLLRLICLVRITQVAPLMPDDRAHAEAA